MPTYSQAVSEKLLPSEVDTKDEMKSVSNGNKGKVHIAQSYITHISERSSTSGSDV